MSIDEGWFKRTTDRPVGRGNNGMVSSELLARIAARERADEAFAKSMGINITYSSTRRRK